MSNSRNHGGKRKGAGRPRKWSFEDVLKIGQECEVRFKAILRADYEAKKKTLISNAVVELKTHHDEVQSIPLEDRQEWLKDEASRSQYMLDVGEEIESINSMAGITEPTNRIFQIVGKAPKGTRSSIIKAIAEEYGLKTKQVDNLWQQYRRFERDS
jgi:hypothetical protein